MTNKQLYVSDDIYWKRKFILDWKTDKDLELREKDMTWYSEYRRFYSISKLKPWTTLNVHKDEVLHVAFSHCGNFFSTTSKDKHVIVWSISKFSSKCISIFKKLKFIAWNFVQLSAFSENNDFLLVSGVYDSPNSSRGEVSIYTFPECQLLRSVLCVPFDCFGSWLNNNSFIVGHFDVLSHNVSVLLYNVHSPIYPKTLFSHPKSSQNTYPFPCRMFKMCNNLANKTQKLLFYACSETIQFGHCLAFAIIEPGIESEEVQQFERDGLLPSQLNITQNNDSTNSYRDEIDSFTYKGSFKSLVNLKAAIIGLVVDEHLEKVFVNCRPWISEDNPEQIKNETELRIFDFTLNLLKVIFNGYAHTPSDRFFIIHLSVSPYYVVSGDEIGNIHIYDSFYNICVCTLPGHENVVNCAAISPTNSHFMCSASDDGTVKFWEFQSVKKHASLGL